MFTINPSLGAAVCPPVRKAPAPWPRAPACYLWLFLHLTFEIILEYRFLYRGLNELLARRRIIETQFQAILARQVQTAASKGELRASRAQYHALAESMIMIATYWLPYQFVLHPRRQPDGAKQSFPKVATGFGIKTLQKQWTPSKHSLGSQRMFAWAYPRDRQCALAGEPLSGARCTRAVRAPFATIPGFWRRRPCQPSSRNGKAFRVATRTSTIQGPRSKSTGRAST
ncbi:MAG: TetR/AcrR family transcriptional regulator, partial [Rhodomicrobium sp.]